MIDSEVHARTPDAAIASVAEDDSTLPYTCLVAVPRSSWHKFTQTTAWVKG